MPTILITEHVHPDALAYLRQETSFEVIEAAGDPAIIRSALAHAEAIGVRVHRLDAAAIDAAPRLKVIAKHGVGTDNIDHAAASARGIVILNTPDANKVAVAEHAMALMLALAKRLAIHDATLRAGDWRFREGLVAQELAGRSLAILGFGRSGQELARRAAAFDMPIIAWGRSIDSAAVERFGGRVASSLGEALSSADFVSLHTPRVHASRPLLGVDEIATMRQGAYLINCARGGLVDEQALADALRENRLAGAGVDVFDVEPPPADNPLLAADLPNLILTPHNAGNTRETTRRVGLEMADNIIAGLQGRHDVSRIVRPPRPS